MTLFNLTESIIGLDLDYIQKSLEITNTQDARNQFEELCEYAKELLMDSRHSAMTLEVRWTLAALMLYGDTFIDWVDMAYSEEDLKEDA